MERKVAKVLDNGNRVVADMNGKRTANCDMYITGATPKLLSKRTASISPINKVVKRRKLDGSNNKSGCFASQFKTSLLKYYSNFTKSGIPQRVMFYQNGEWNDFPHDLITLIRKDLQVKKAAIDVEYNGHSFILDFLHMVRLDSRTGFSLPMAWIDELGKCFFPETFSGDEHKECRLHDFEGDQEDLFSGPAYQDIRLQLEIEVKESDRSKFKECTGDSDAFVKLVPVDEKFASGRCDLEVEESFPKPSDVGEFKQIGKNVIPNIEHGELNRNEVRKLFFMGIGSSVSADIVDLYRGSSSSMQARLELFYKQVEITNKYRGDANVRYGWFPTTKEELSSILMYGLGHIETSKVNSTYGLGVLLSPANCAFNSSSFYDVDEKGVRHMVLCRVIMGNMELIHEGSKQFHPSGEDFDSGVDDLQNPTHFIVWNMNKNSHIYPEYVVSFKVSSDATGFVANNVRKLDFSGVTATSPEPAPIHSNISLAQSNPVEKVQEKVPDLDSSTKRIPRSPWVAFPTLLAAVSKKIHPEFVKLLESDYQLLRSKKISRQDYIRKLRFAVGDTLLRSTITDLHSKEKWGNDSKQLATRVEFAADEVMPNVGSNPIP